MDNGDLPPAELNLRTTVQLSEISYERAVLKSLLAQAQASGDATFSVFREAHMAVGLGPLALLDQLAAFRDCLCTRPDSHTLILRSVGIFGIVDVSGSAENCSVNLQLWADSAKRGDSARERILAAIRPHEITDVAFSLNWGCRQEGEYYVR